MKFVDRNVAGDVTPLSWLADRLAAAASCEIMTGFLNQAGINLLATPLRDMLDRGGQLHIIVDFRDGEPSAVDLRWLVEWLAPYGERASVTLWRGDNRLHSKVVLVTDAIGHQHAMVGSVNLTYAGLMKNHEAYVWLEPSDGLETFTDIKAALHKTRADPASLTVDIGTVSSLAGAVGTNMIGVSLPIVDLFQPMLDEIEAMYAPGGGIGSGVPTGFNDLDRLLNGLQAGQLVLIAGRPGIGKSVLALDFSRSAAVRHNQPVLYLSFEMTANELTQRFTAAESRVPLNVLRSGQLSDDDWTRVARRMGETMDAPLFFNSSTIASIRHVAAEARRMHAQHALKMIVVDHIQLLSLDRRTNTRQEEVSGVSRQLKRLAIELDVPIVAVSQLNREPESRADKRPQLWDLRDSGGLEQDADIVILLHRDDFYDRETPRAGEADFIVAKHRNGPTDTITVAAQLHLCRFVDMAMQPLPRP